MLSRGVRGRFTRCPEIPLRTSTWVVFHSRCTIFIVTPSACIATTRSRGVLASLIMWWSCIALLEVCDVWGDVGSISAVFRPLPRKYRRGPPAYATAVGDAQLMDTKVVEKCLDFTWSSCCLRCSLCSDIFILHWPGSKYLILFHAGHPNNSYHQYLYHSWSYICTIFFVIISSSVTFSCSFWVMNCVGHVTTVVSPLVLVVVKASMWSNRFNLVPFLVWTAGVFFINTLTFTLLSHCVAWCVRSLGSVFRVFRVVFVGPHSSDDCPATWNSE